MNLTIIQATACVLALIMMFAHSMSLKHKTGSTAQTIYRVVFMICALGMLLLGLSLVGLASLGARS